ncbi:DExH-box ATP-dependent RNA helicase DExH15 chloroplastic [Asimina triloba]
MSSISLSQTRRALLPSIFFLRFAMHQSLNSTFYHFHSLADSSRLLLLPLPSRRPPLLTFLPSNLFPLPHLTSRSASRRPFLRCHSPIHSPKPCKNQEFYNIEDDDEEEDGGDADEDIAAEEYEGFSDEYGGLEDGTTAAATAVSLEVPRYEEHKWQRVERLRTEVREFGDGIIDIEELASIYDFPIDKFQRSAIQAFLRGSSVVVSAPTSSGKTLIAEAAAAATIARGRRLFYTTPLKALSNQKYRDFCGTFGENNVGLLTGDASVNKDAPILIMTTEILRNMLYQSVGMFSSGSRLFNVDVIVLDEVHYLSDISRGTVWEEIIHGKTELVTSKKRPVPLSWHFSTKNSLVPLLDEKGKKMNRKLSLNYLQLSSSGINSNKEDGPRRQNIRKGESILNYNRTNSISGLAALSKNDINAIRRSQVPQIRDTLQQLRARDMLPAVWFIISRKGCDAAVQYLDGSKLLDDCEISEVELALKKFRIRYPDAVREMAVEGLLQGVAAHHAGCLPLWKSFIEELFQQGLVKVVFATETLAAGINMPARTAVISSLSRRIEKGRTLLSPNDLFQMAGRAGRRGIDERGHAVLVQTPYEGAEECCKILFASLEPLVSQFTASYGMVLNLLSGAKVTNKAKENSGGKAFQAGRTLEEARKIIEQSFGNYVGSNVMNSAKEELSKIEKEIEFLTSEASEEAIERKCREQLSEEAYREIFDLQQELQEEKRFRTELRWRMKLERMATLKTQLKELDTGHLNFICLKYKDKEEVSHIVTAIYLGEVDSFTSSKFQHMICGLEIEFQADLSGIEIGGQIDSKPSYYAALGSDNSWYLFTERWITTLYRTGFPNVPLAEGDALPREIMIGLLEKEDFQWEKLSRSDFGGLWRMDGSLETWSWSLNVPVLSSLSEDDEVLQVSSAYHELGESYKEQRRKVSRLKEKIIRTNGFQEFKKIVDMTDFMKEKIKHLKARSDRLANRLEQIEPSGWKEFVKISNVIHEARALDINTHVIFPLGETAAAIRGENELWLAIVLRNKILIGLKPAELAAVCASLVSEGIKIRASKDNIYIYEPSSKVLDVISLLDEQRSSFLQLQEKHGVDVPCELDSQFSGMVEAWASGLTWREIMMDCAMDDGDLARLLRRTIDLLAQIPKLPDIDPLLQNNAMIAANVMDRVPVSELAG